MLIRKILKSVIALNNIQWNIMSGCTEWVYSALRLLNSPGEITHLNASHCKPDRYRLEVKVWWYRGMFWTSRMFRCLANISLEKTVCVLWSNRSIWSAVCQYSEDLSSLLRSIFEVDLGSILKVYLKSLSLINRAVQCQCYGQCTGSVLKRTVRQLVSWKVTI